MAVFQSVVDERRKICDTVTTRLNNNPKMSTALKTTHLVLRGFNFMD